MILGRWRRARGVMLLHQHSLPLYGQLFVNDKTGFIVDARRDIQGIAGISLGNCIGNRGAWIARIGTVIPRIASVSGYMRPQEADRGKPQMGSTPISR